MRTDDCTIEKKSCTRIQSMQSSCLFVDLRRNRKRRMEIHDVKELYWFLYFLYFIFYILALCAYIKVGYPTRCVYIYTAMRFVTVHTGRRLG